MAQLPPKVPQNWPSFPPQRIPATLPNFINSTASPSPSLATMMTGSSTNQIPPSWVDEFLDFSSIRRGAHRRSISDSIAFLDPPLDEESKPRPESNAILPSETNIGFDRLDDEQLTFMFSDDVSLSLPPTVSSSSEQNSNNNDEKTATTPLDHQQHPKTEPGEVQSSCKPEPQPLTQPQPQPPPTSNPDSIDPKRVKRILANRQSAQRSRVRKLQYISELERSVTTLQTEVSALSPRVAFLDHQRVILTVDNSAMKQRIAALAQDKIFKDAHQEALKKEIERLTQLMHHQQRLQKMNSATTDNHAPPQQPPSNADPIVCTDKEQVFN